jgi:acyl carrier protein
MAEAMFEAFARLLERLADEPAAWEEGSPVEASSEQARWREQYRPATPARPRRPRRSGPLDERIAAAVREELGLDRLDPDLHVLEQGATSLELVRLADGLEDRLGVRPELELLFAPQSAGELVDGLAKLTTEVPA